jgi:metal-responsive CopG/Arc/MetJ family transcriptional regulator
MRKTVVQSLSLPTEIAAESARVAKELGKSRSTLFVEAIRAYLRLYRFKKLQDKVKPQRGYRRIKSEEQVDRLVHDYRRGKRA